MTDGITEKKRKHITAVVPAAGRSARMGGENKLLADLGGKPVIIRTLEALSRDERINEIVLVLSSPLQNEIKFVLKKYPIPRLIKMVEGGEERQESVFAGVSASTGEIVAIHDGARPLLSAELLKNLLDPAEDFPGIVPSLPIQDTVKKIGPDGFVLETLNRSEIFRIQTPQVFSREAYLNAYNKALREGKLFTDDSALVENAGYRVKTIPGDERNLKITIPQDLNTARIIFQSNFSAR